MTATTPTALPTGPEAITAGPDRAQLALWVLDRRNHPSLQFQTASGPIDVNIMLVGPEEGTGRIWLMWGEVMGCDNSLYAVIVYDVKKRKGSVRFTTQAPAVHM